jgi:hypothetical protein
VQVLIALLLDEPAVGAVERRQLGGGCGIMRTVSKARKLIAVGAAIVALEILAVSLFSPALVPGATSWSSSLPLLAAGALGLAAGALDVGLLLRLGRAAYVRSLGSILIIIGLVLLAIIVGYFALVAALTVAWDWNRTGP